MDSFLSFARRRAAVMFGVAIVALLLGVVMVWRVSFDANILRLLPQRLASVRDFKSFLQDFGSLDHLYVVFDAAESIGEHEALVDAYVDALRKAPEVESVDSQLFESGKDWSYLSDRELYLLGEPSATQALKRFQSPALELEIAHARELLSMPSSDVKALVRQDPLGLLTMLRDRIGQEKGFISFDPTQNGYVAPNGRSRLVIVKPKGPPFDTDFCKALFRRLVEVEAAARRAVADDDPSSATVTIQAAGSYRVALEAEALIRREGIVNTLASLVLLLLLVYIVFRTPWVMVYGLAPLGIAAVLTLGINGRIQRSISPATSGSAGMLFGLGIDGVILLYMRYLEERRDGRSADDAVRRMGPTASSVVLAQLTTAATFFALLFVDFPTLQDLGSLVGVGILICCLLTLLLLPGSLPRQTGSASRRTLAAPWLGRFVTRATRPIVWGTIVATVVLAAASTRLRLDTSIDKLQAQTSGTSLEREVAARFSLPGDVLIVLNEHRDIAALLEIDARLDRALAAHAPSVSASGIGFMLPPDSEQDKVARAIVGAGATPEDTRLRIQQAAKAAGFRPDTFDPFFERLSHLLNPRERISYEGLVSHGLDSIVSRFVVHRDGRYRAATYLYPRGPIDLDTLRQTIHDVDPGLRLTGISVINSDLRRQFFPEFVKGLAIGTVAVAILIYLVFRTFRHTLLAFVPTVVGFVWSAGVLTLAGVELDLFSLFAAVTFVGIAVDYGIYVLYRYVFEPTSTMADVMARTGSAIAIACATALVGFGTLVNSSYAPLHVFGIVSIVTLASCLIVSVVSLPALILELERWFSVR